MKKSKKIIIKGLVQGIGFRSFIHYYALKYDISGYAKNCPDGCVEVVGKGKDSNLDKFIEHISKGPPGAKITEINISDLKDDSLNFKGFRIIRWKKNLKII